MKYQYLTNKLFCIWFHKNEPSDMNNDFMPYLNIKRLIRMKKLNPNATISLIFDSRLLTNIGYERLKIFCNIFRINPVDFNDYCNEFFKNKINIESNRTNENQDDILSDLDITLTIIAQNEIKKCFEKTGGNFAAASDIVRLLNKNIVELGHYFDFDTVVCYKGVNFIQADSPFIIYGSLENDVYVDSICNEFMAYAIDESGKLHEDAKPFLIDYKSNIIERYRRENLPSIFKKSQHRISPVSMDTTKYFRVNFESAPDIFSFRALIEEAFPFEKQFAKTRGPLLKNDEELNIFISNLDKIRVVSAFKKVTCGDENYQDIPFDKASLSDKTELEIVNDYWSIMLSEFLKLSVLEFSGPEVLSKVCQRQYQQYQYNPLHSSTPFAQHVNGSIIRKDELEKLSSERLTTLKFSSNDMSWTRYGQDVLKNRSLEAATTDIQRYYRKHKLNSKCTPR